MSTRTFSGCFAIAMLVCSGYEPAHAAASVGAAAPAFSVAGMNGPAVTLDQYRGHYVVLEWTNSDCPFVRHYYDRGDMQALQKTYTGKGVIWLTVTSSGKGKEGYVADAAAARSMTTRRNAAPTDVLLDSDGKLGRLYGAKTTPQMFLVDPQGKLIYAGAIDGTPSTDPADIASAPPYLRNALDEALSGKPVSRPATVSYGCSVKY